MADEPNTIAETEATELDTPAIESEDTDNTEPEDLEASEGEEGEAGSEDDDSDGEDGGEEADDTDTDDDDELETIEHKGKSYKVPKDLPGLLMQKDYTQKTQEIASERRTLEVAKQITDAELQARSHLTQIDQALKQFENVDWDAYEQQDPLAAQSHWRQYQQLQGNKNAAVQSLTQVQQARSAAAEHDYATRARQAAAYAQKEIKGWTPKLGDELYHFAKSSGLSEEGIKNSMSPQFVAFLHKAHIGDQMLKGKAQPKSKAPAPKPLQTVKAKSSSNTRTDLRNADMDAYVAARRRGVGG